MFIGAKKDTSVDTPSSLELQPQAFNFSMMTRSQLAVNIRTPRAPPRGLPITGRDPIASLIMFHQDSPYTPHRAAATVNATSTSQGSQATIVGSSGGQDFPINPIVSTENVDLRDYRSNFKGEHTTTAEW